MHTIVHKIIITKAKIKKCTGNNMQFQEDESINILWVTIVHAVIFDCANSNDAYATDIKSLKMAGFIRSLFRSEYTYIVKPYYSYTQAIHCSLCTWDAITLYESMVQSYKLKHFC